MGVTLPHHMMVHGRDSAIALTVYSIQDPPCLWSFFWLIALAPVLVVIHTNVIFLQSGVRPNRTKICSASVLQ